MPTLRDGSRSADPRLCRVPWFDDASRRYPVRALFNEGAAPTSKTWRCTVYLDQKRQGACAGFAAAHALAAAPHMVRAGIDETFARETIYFAAQRLDPFPGGAYPGAKVFTAGSTILASMKTLHRLGYLAEYRWAFGAGEVCRALWEVGPVILGLPWYEGMSDPACCGMLHPTGRRVGAHAILARGVDLRKKTVLVHNSFGRRWGNGGTALIHWDDLAFLLDGSKDGEACVPIKRLRQTAPRSRSL